VKVKNLMFICEHNVIKHEVKDNNENTWDQYWRAFSKNKKSWV